MSRHNEGTVEDVGKRRQIQEELRESEERFRSTFEQAAVGIAHVAPTGKFLRINQRFCDIVGYPREELLKLTFQEITHREDVDTDVTLAQEVLDGKKATYSIEKRYLRKDRSVIWVVLTVSLVRSATGDPRYFISVVDDITERKRTEEELRRRAEFDSLVNRLLARFASCSASDVDEHISGSLWELCRFVGAESGFVSLLSDDASSWRITHEWSGPGIAPVSKRCQNQPLGTLPWVDARLLAGKAIRFRSLDDLPAEASVERKLYADDGVRSVLELPLRGRGGASRGCIGLRSHTAERDWSEADESCLGIVADTIVNGLDRKRAEDALRVNEERFRTIVQQAGDFITVHDGDGRFIYESPSTETVLGYGPGELIGRDPLTLVHPEDLEMVRQEFERTYDGTNSGFPTEYRVRHADGHWIQVETLGRNLLHNPAVGGVVLTSRDITWRKRTERALVESERRLRLVLDNSWEVLVLWTVESPDHFRVATVNRAYTELLHRGGIAVDAESLVGKTFEEVFEGVVGLAHEVVEADKLRLKRAVETRRGSTYEMSMDAPAGTFIFEMTLCPVLDNVGRCTHLLRASHEITKRKRALEELSRSEERFSKAFRSSPAPMAISRAQDGMIVDINKAFEEMTGFGRHELVGGSTVNGGFWVNPPDRERLLEVLATAGSVRGEEVKFRTKTGGAITVRYSAVSVDLGGEPCLLSVFIDVTERLRAEEALRSEKAFTDSLIESLPGTFFAYEQGERLVRWNSACERITGWSAAELAGMDPLALIEETERPIVAQKIREVLETGSADVETRVLTKDGHVIPFTLSGGRVVIGGQTYVVGVGFDITERKRGEERQARLREEVLAAATEWAETFDTVKSALIVTDCYGTVRRLNVAARDLAGGQWGDVLGRHLAQLGEGEPWQTAGRLVDRAAALGKASAADVRDSRGQREWALEAVRFDTAPDRVITVVQDITTLMELQDSLQREETMSAMGALVAGVAHEVRNPLFGISGLLDALDAKFGRDARLGEYFDALRRETDRLTTLMQALLEFGRPISEERAELPLALVAREAVQLCRRDAAARDVRILVDLPDTLPNVPMDRMRMVEVLRNLVENAVQYSPTGGKVVVAAQIPQPPRPGWLEVTVSDSGPGFDEADRTKLFEPFFSRRSGGTGLGLSIVRRVVTAHGGEVRAGNQPNGGGVVTIRLPIGGP